MARAPRNTTPANIVITDADTPALPAMVEAANVLAVRSAAVAEQFGDGLPYERERVVNETRFFMAQSAEAMLETGKRLIQIKENEAHGEFARIVEERLGIEVRVARRMMQAAIRFLGSDGAKRTTLSVLGKSKLYELMVLDDDELDALAAGETVLGLQRDGIDGMSARELRAALREARENADAQGRRLAEKITKIDELAAKLSARKTRVKVLPPDEEGEEIRKEAAAFAFEAEATLRGKLNAAFQALTEHEEKHGSSHEDFMAGLLCQIERVVKEVRSAFGLKAAPDGEDVPAWVRSAGIDSGFSDPAAVGSPVGAGA